MSETTMHSVGSSPCITHSGEEPIRKLGSGMTIDLLVLPSSVKMKRGRIAPSKLARFLLVGVA